MYVLVDVLGFVIVLYQGVVFEYILFCLVCFATTWFFPHVLFVLELIIVLYQNRVFEHRFGGPKTKLYIYIYSRYQQAGSSCILYVVVHNTRVVNRHYRYPWGKIIHIVYTWYRLVVLRRLLRTWYSLF